MEKFSTAKGKEQNIPFLGDLEGPAWAAFSGPDFNERSKDLKDLLTHQVTDELYQNILDIPRFLTRLSATLIPIVGVERAEAKLIDIQNKYFKDLQTADGKMLATKINQGMQLLSRNLENEFLGKRVVVSESVEEQVESAKVSTKLTANPQTAATISPTVLRGGSAALPVEEVSPFAKKNQTQISHDGTPRKEVMVDAKNPDMYSVSSIQREIEEMDNIATESDERANEFAESNKQAIVQKKPIPEFVSVRTVPAEELASIKLESVPTTVVEVVNSQPVFVSRRSNPFAPVPQSVVSERTVPVTAEKLPVLVLTNPELSTDTLATNDGVVTAEGLATTHSELNDTPEEISTSSEEGLNNLDQEAEDVNFLNEEERNLFYNEVRLQVADVQAKAQQYFNKTINTPNVHREGLQAASNVRLFFAGNFTKHFSKLEDVITKMQETLKTSRI